MILCLLLLTLPSSQSLNLDQRNPRIFTGPGRSFFGFSIDFYKAADDRMNIVVGAPKLNLSATGIRNGGGVFLCPWGLESNNCSSIAFDRPVNQTVTEDGTTIIYQSDQWLGATVRTWNTSIVVGMMACAPLQHYNYAEVTSESGRSPTGSCYITDDLKSFQEFAPCRDTKTEWYHLNVDSGLYAAVPLSNILGASDSMLQTFPDFYLSAEHFVNDSYKGFAVTFGEFTEDDFPVMSLPVGRAGTQMRFRFISRRVVGSDLMEVEIYSGAHKLASIAGDQIAAYFGHSVAVTDVNGDNLDDLLVGAPLYMERKAGGKFLEVGQVYVYMQRSPSNIDRERQVLSGIHVYGQFGASIAPLGDLDQDGYNDVAVGSPFGGQSGAGCVYIYRGERSGLSAFPSQILEGPLEPPSRFGFALKGGEDIDQNGYPDLIVGAFEADSVYVYSFSVAICVQTSGKSLPSTLTFSADIQLDSLKSRFLRRVFFAGLSQPNNTIFVDVRSNAPMTCINDTVHLQDEEELKDKLSPVAVSVNFSLERNQLSGALPPLIQGNTFLQQQLYFLLDCGEDNVCVPDLQLTVSWSEEPLVIGADNFIQITFTATNLGEGAYEAELRIWLPPGAHFMRVLGETKEKILCTPRKENDTELVVCELGNPMKKGAQIQRRLQLSISNLENSEGEFSFPMQITSRNSQNSSSPVVLVHFDVTVEASVQLHGRSQPAEVLLPLDNWKPSEESGNAQDKGKTVTHIFELYNAGQSSVNMELVIQSPEAYDGDLFLYPLHLKTDDSVQCADISGLNSLQLNTEEATKPPVSFSKSDGRRINKRDKPQDVGNDGSDNSTSRGNVPRSKQPVALSCDNARCWKTKCDIQNLAKGERALVRLDSILWVSSFLKAETLVQWAPPGGQKEIPPWCLILGVLGGLLVLASLIYVMWKFGFFRRARPPPPPGARELTDGK
ncbi:integrin alpha-IIb-like [Gastrophryne carolinensis]